MSFCGRCGTDHIVHCTGEARLRSQVRDRDELLEATQKEIERLRDELYHETGQEEPLSAQLAVTVEEPWECVDVADRSLAKIRGGAGRGVAVVIVACLYVDIARGPYAALDGVECWGLPDRDARLYAGPHPVVAHPPCGPWGFLARGAYGKRPTAATMATKDCAIAAVEAIRKWGGVLEHPALSLLWEECRMPRPGCLPDEFGGVTVGIQQVEWGGPTRKPTWLYCVGCDDIRPAPMPGRVPVAAFTGSRRDGYTGRHLPKRYRHLTPPLLAAELVRLARTVTRS